jgi:hypothetical protein
MNVLKGDFIMLSKIINWFEERKLEKEFQKRKEEIMKKDPFIYEIPQNDPTRYKTWESKGKDIDF